jgi:hypothetical protein
MRGHDSANLTLIVMHKTALAQQRGVERDGQSRQTQ